MDNTHRTIEQAAADDLLDIAFELSNSGSAFLLIESACRLNSKLDKQVIVALWTKEHMEVEYQRRLALGYIHITDDTVKQI